MTPGELVFSSGYHTNIPKYVNTGKNTKWDLAKLKTEKAKSNFYKPITEKGYRVWLPKGDDCKNDFWNCLLSCYENSMPTLSKSLSSNNILDWAIKLIGSIAGTFGAVITGFGYLPKFVAKKILPRVFYAKRWSQNTDLWAILSLYLKQIGTIPIDVGTRGTGKLVPTLRDTAQWAILAIGGYYATRQLDCWAKCAGFKLGNCQRR